VVVVKIEVGQACTKIAGRENGRNCLIVDIVDDNFVTIAGPGIKRRRCNVKHLNFLPQKLGVKKGAADSEAVDALVKAGLAELSKESPRKQREKEAPKEKPVQKPEAKKEEKKPEEKKKIFARKPKADKPKKEDKKKAKKAQAEAEIMKEVQAELKGKK
jgi:large subunit ribosomal protein L14e